MALLLEHKVTHRQNLIAGQDIRLDLGRNGESQPRDHAAGIVFHRHIDKIPQFSKVDDIFEVLFHISAVVAQHRTVQKHVFPRGQIEVKARAQLDQRRNFAVDGDGTPGWVHDARNKFEHRAFAAAVAANQRYGFAGFDAERDVLQRIKFIEKKLMFQQLDGIFLEGLGFLLR